MQGVGIHVLCYCAFLGTKHRIMQGSSCTPKATHPYSLEKSQQGQPLKMRGFDKQQSEQNKQRTFELDGRNSGLTQQHTQPAGHSQHTRASPAQLQQLEQAVQGQLPHDLAAKLPRLVAKGDDAANPPTAHAASAGGASGVESLGAAEPCRNEGVIATVRTSHGLEWHAGLAERQQLSLQQGVGVSKGRVSGVKRPGSASERSSSGSSSEFFAFCNQPHNPTQRQSRLQQLGRLQQASSPNKPQLSKAVVQQMLTQGARLRAQRQQRPYTSKLGGNCSSLCSGNMTNYVQQICRVRGICLPL